MRNKLRAGSNADRDPAVGGLDVYSGKERSDLELLKRIKMGRERLRRFPGGEELGGGEKWFNQVSTWFESSY